MSTNDGTQKQNTVEVENHHCSKCGWERLLWRPQDKCAHVLICPLCLMTRPHSSQECDKYTGIRIEKLEVQVEVYRKALEEITHCGLLATEVEDLVANAAHVLEVAKEALLTSKPEVQADLSVGRDDRWEKLEAALRDGIIRNLNSAEYQKAVEDIYNMMESMSAKEGE